MARSAAAARSEAAAAAYQAAVQEIEKARKDGQTQLALSGKRFNDLDVLPPEIADLIKLTLVNLSNTQVSDLNPFAAMTGLTSLFLSNTQVRDLSPLAAMTAMTRLDLSHTQVSDITPLAEMTGLKTLFLNSTQVSDLSQIRDFPLEVNDFERGLAFAGTPATEKDPELARLAAIKDNTQRTAQTLAYLKTLPPWPEPLPWLVEEEEEEEAGDTKGTPPEQDPALPLIWGEKGFAFFARSIEDDPVTEASLGDMRALLEDLRRKGNRHDDLYRLAGEVQDRSKGEIADLNMVKLHLSFQKLRRLYQSRSSRSEGFDDETVGVLGSVLEILPGVTMADPGVRTLIERQEAERLAGTTLEKAKAESDVLNAVQSEDAPFADEVKDVAKAILESGQNDRLAATRGILSRNTLIAVLKGISYSAAGAAIYGPIGNYVYDHGLELLALARTMGDDAFFWAQMVLTSFKAEYQIASGLVREAISSGSIALPRKNERDKQ